MKFCYHLCSSPIRNTSWACKRGIDCDESCRSDTCLWTRPAPCRCTHDCGECFSWRSRNSLNEWSKKWSSCVETWKRQKLERNEKDFQELVKDFLSSKKWSELKPKDVLKSFTQIKRINEKQNYSSLFETGILWYQTWFLL